jgi:peptidoglycan/LPS O-acetylase OafA/YrhL
MDTTSTPATHTDRPDYRVFLDKLRWISAGIVAVGHAIGILNSQSGGSNLLTLIADMRGPAVDIFFVLSGYLVGGVVLRNISGFDFRKYAIARFSRIYIVLLPAIALTLALDGLIYLIDPANPVYTSAWQGGALGSSAVFSRYSATEIIGTLLSLEPFFGRPIGSAGSLWSLGYEWIFYFVFPAICRTGFKLGGKPGVLIAIATSVICTFMTSKISAGFWLIWLLGAFASTIRFESISSSKVAESIAKSLAFAVIMVFLLIGEHLSNRISMLVIGGAGFIFLVCQPLWEKRLTSPIDKTLAGFSYSLYVTHLQLQTFSAALMFKFGLLPVDGIKSPATVLAIALLFVVMSAALAYLMGRMFESRTQELSRWLMQVLPGGREPRQDAAILKN